MKIIKTKMFIKEAKRLNFSGKHLLELENSLIENPEKGEYIQSGLGLRKIRVGLGNKGKRGGARVIYFVEYFEDGIILLLYIYAKNEKENLSHKELETLKQIIK